MTLDKKTLFSLLLGFDLLANILELTHVNFLYTTTLISFCTCILLPGFLISFILRLRKISFWENLLLVIGLSIVFLEFGGLLLNILLPLFGVNNPLAFQNVIIGFNIYMLLLFLFAWIRTKQLAFQIKIPRRSNIEKVMFVPPAFFPVLATLGAIVLNNGGSNILILIQLGTIALYSLLLVLVRNKISADLYPYAIFFIGMASLLTDSLRSWYIAGSDVNREFYVFMLTNVHHIWNMAFYQDAYNACLSITILPTILINFLSIQDMYVYKVIFQILFATSPVLVFFILRNYTTPVFAFLSAFFFISFPTFFSDMPSGREEIGFILFGLALYMMLKRDRTRQFYTKFDKLPLPDLSLPTRKIVFMIFALGIIISHYSTNFVLLALVAFVYILTRIISLSFVKNTFAFLLSKSHARLKNTFTHQAFLSLPLLLILFSVTYLWNTLYTHSSDHAGSVLSQVVSGLLVKSKADKSVDLDYSIFFSPPKQDPNQQLQEYIQNVIQSEKLNTTKLDADQFYNKSITDKYPTYSIPQEQLTPTPFGNLLASFHIPVFDIQAESRSLSASLLQIFIFIGLLAIFLSKNKKAFDLQYLLLCFGAIVLLALAIVLPVVSAEYGILRLFQQLLFILSLPIVLGLSSILFFAKEQKKILFTGIIAIIFFLNLTGFISHLTGDYYPQMTLDNSGLGYDVYYVHKSDILAIAWLSQNNVNNEPVEVASSQPNKLLAYGNIYALNGVFPQTIRKNAYVYLEASSNIIVFTSKYTLIFNSAQPFLGDTKNLIYSNGKNNIYK